MTGFTASTDFPTSNPLQPTNDGGVDAFVAAFDPTGQTLLYSTYLGGSGDDYGQGIAVDSVGDAYVTGYTGSTNFPTSNPLQPTNHGGADAFVAALDPAGATLLYSTYLGGSAGDVGYGIAVDSAGNAYVTGSTGSTNFPTSNPFQPTNRGNNDLLASLSPVPHGQPVAERYWLEAEGGVFARVDNRTKSTRVEGVGGFMKSEFTESRAQRASGEHLCVLS